MTTEAKIIKKIRRLCVTERKHIAMGNFEMADACQMKIYRLRLELSLEARRQSHSEFLHEKEVVIFD